MTLLTASALDRLGPSVQRPKYDPATVTTNIVHFGVGAFHRAHEAMFVDRLLNRGVREWGICGVGLLPYDRSVRDALHRQDNLYTLVTVSPAGDEDATVIGSIREYLYAPDDPEAVIGKVASADVRIVSMTITEAGYGVSDATGAYEPSDEATLADLASPRPSRSPFGLIYSGAAERMRAGLPGFTLMSCDNIEGNGDVARAALLGFARRKDPSVATWIESNVSFPSSMVDRITPATTDSVRSDLLTRFGIQDAWPVRSESFVQWVLEDDFPYGRPEWERVGVQMVHDVEPYELMKLRLLNAAHQAIGHLGLFAGHTFVHEVCRQPVFAEFLLGYMLGEAVPTLRPVPGVDLEEYARELIARFSSTAILDPLARLTTDASARIPKFLLPVVREQLARRGDVQRCAIIVAAWSVGLLGRVKSGGPLPATDLRLPDLVDRAQRDAAQRGAFLDFVDVFGDLGESPVFRAEYVAARASLLSRGVVPTLTDLGGVTVTPGRSVPAAPRA